MMLSLGQKTLWQNTAEMMYSLPATQWESKPELLEPFHAWPMKEINELNRDYPAKVVCGPWQM